MRLEGWTPPRCARSLCDSGNRSKLGPKRLQPIISGIRNNVAAVALLSDYPFFVRAAKGNTLLVCVLPMPFTTYCTTVGGRNELVWAYTGLPNGPV